MNKKICGKCQLEKDISEFHKNPQCQDGLRRECKSCRRKYERQRFEANPRPLPETFHCRVCKKEVRKTRKEIEKRICTAGRLCAECTGSKEMRYEIRRKRYEEMRRPKAAAYQRDRYQRIGRHDRVKVKEYWIVRMGGKCIRCGLQFGLNWPSCVFDFHHKKPSEKGESVAKLLRCADKNRTKRELKKTVLLCSNCHRKEHNHG